MLLKKKEEKQRGVCVCAQSLAGSQATIDPMTDREATSWGTGGVPARGFLGKALVLFSYFGVLCVSI
jgi:hypothetical protein